MRWPIYQHIFFDCDSTLTAVEGIDILAETAGKKWDVESLTTAAMDGELDLEEVYGKRLNAIRPTRRQVRAIRSRYKKNVVADAAAVIRALQSLGHHVYIISGGLYEPVKEFGLYLGVPEENIRAVNVHYDALSGAWWQRIDPDLGEQYKAYQPGALTVSDGKADIIDEILTQRAGNGRTRSLLIGDGRSDLLASRRVDLFVGYGGVVKRQRVYNEAPVYLHSRSLTPLLALAIGPGGLALFDRTPYQSLAEKALHLISRGEITFQNERLGKKFQQAYQAIPSRPH